MLLIPSFYFTWHNLCTAPHLFVCLLLWPLKPVCATCFLYSFSGALYLHTTIFIFFHFTATSWNANNSIHFCTMPRRIIPSPNLQTAKSDLGRWAKTVIAAKTPMPTPKTVDDLLPGVTNHLKDLPDVVFQPKEPSLEQWMEHLDLHGGELVLHEWMPLPSVGTHPMALHPARPQDPIKDRNRRPHPIHNPGAWVNSSFCDWPEDLIPEGPQEMTALLKPIIPPKKSAVTQLHWRKLK